VADAISWFFSEQTEGIILEDDCVPHVDFFRYCDEMLARYRDDRRVMAVSGDNSSSLELSGAWSYGFIRHPNVWGWATWRRAWELYDDEMHAWQRVSDDDDALRLIFPEDIERTRMKHLFDALVRTGSPDSWGYRWTASCILAGGLAAIPRVNMVQNIGFGADATHTRRKSDDPGLAAESPFPLTHPPMVLYDRPAERQVFSRGSDLLFGLAKWKRRARTAGTLALSPSRWRELLRVLRHRMRKP
jgi:hypothetical protein